MVTVDDLPDTLKLYSLLADKNPLFVSESRPVSFFLRYFALEAVELNKRQNIPLDHQIEIASKFTDLTYSPSFFLSEVINSK